MPNEGQGKRFTATVVAPSKLSVDGDLAANWKRFERQWEVYFKASRLDKERDGEFQVSVLLSTLGEDAMDIYDGLSFATAADRKIVSKVLDAFRAYCVGEQNEAYEAYRFHCRKQEPGETIEAFVTALKKLSKTVTLGPWRIDSLETNSSLVFKTALFERKCWRRKLRH